MIEKLEVPISDEKVVSLRVGTLVNLSGVVVTARDVAHKYMVEKLMGPEIPPQEQEVYQALRDALGGGVIYHCGPIVRRAGGRWEIVAAGPTTSIREEPYQDRVIARFNVKAVLGKGGMGPRTLRACQEHRCVYLHAVGGAAVVMAEHVEEVLDVYKEAFGHPEAFWKIRVRDLPAVVTMDAHGNSLHRDVADRSRRKLEELLQ